MERCLQNKYLPDILTTGEVAQLWGIHQATIQAACRSERLFCRQSGTTWLTTFGSVLSFYQYPKSLEGTKYESIRDAAINNIPFGEDEKCQRLCLHYVLTVVEASDIWGAERFTIQAACRNKKLLCRRSGRTWLIPIFAMIDYFGLPNTLEALKKTPYDSFENMLLDNKFMETEKSS